VLSISGGHQVKIKPGKKEISKPGHSENRARSIPSLLPPEEPLRGKDPGQNHRKAQRLPHLPHKLYGGYVVTSHSLPWKDGSDPQQTPPMAKISANMKL